MNEKIEREILLADETVEILKQKLKKKRISRDEIVAISKYVYDVYTGVENILKILLKNKNIKIKNTPTWHRDLIELAFKNNLISQVLFNNLYEILAFRHFFVHGYAVILDKDKVLEICKKAIMLWQKFKKEISTLL